MAALKLLKNVGSYRLEPTFELTNKWKISPAQPPFSFFCRRNSAHSWKGWTRLCIYKNTWAIVGHSKIGITRAHACSQNSFVGRLVLQFSASDIFGSYGRPEGAGCRAHKPRQKREEPCATNSITLKKEI